MRPYTFFLFILIGILSLSSLSAQLYKQQNNIPVLINGDTLVSAWAGAMNAPQFSAVDINLDGLKDIVAFDREDHSFTPYINEGGPGETKYRFDPDYVKVFENCQCDGWALLVDYNCDGLEDVICGNNSNVDVYDQRIGFAGILFEKTQTQVESWYGASRLWLYSGKIDLPAIVDADDDGDIDFLTWKLGFNTMELHRNMAMEDYNRCDTLVFREQTGCWGHVVENSVTNDMTLHDTTFCILDGFNPSGCIGVGRPGKGGDDPGDLTESGRHTGSTTLLLDLDADGVKEALIGDVSFNNVVGLHNCGRLDYAYIDSTDNLFPRYDVPVDMAIFPANFYVDIDNDGIRDLIVAPNSTTTAENAQSVLTYLNNGQDNYPDFEHQGRGFLQSKTMEFGSGSAPAFFDYNNDGLLDLLVGNRGYFNKNTGIYEHGLGLYENTGSADIPIFTLVDDNYLGLIGGATVGLLSLVPALADLDGDNDPDLLLGTANGTIFYYENQAMAGMDADFVYITDQYQQIDVNSNSAPELFDMDNDGDLDLFVGNERGKVAYYVNEGSATAANFKEVAPEWGFIHILDQYGGAFTGNAKPRVVDYDGDGDVEMLVGGVMGVVEKFEITGNPLTDTLVSSGQLFDHNVGSMSALAAAVIDSTGDITYMIGNQRGGLHLFNTLPDDLSPPVSIDKDLAAEIGLQIFPNPAQDDVFITWEQTSPNEVVNVSVYNTIGQTISKTSRASSPLSIDLRLQAAGMYIVRVEIDGKAVAKKILVE